MPWSSSKHPGSTRQSRVERRIILAHWPICYLQYDGCTHTSTEDDHVIPLHKGGSKQMHNRRGACHHCHGIKTRREATEARATRGPRKRPPEPHPGLIT